MSTPAPATQSPAAAGSREIAVIGRSGDATCDAVASFVSGLGWTPAVISPQPHENGDLGALESLEVLRGIEFAIVLQADSLLEIGFLLGSLGRQRIHLLGGGKGQFTLDDAGLWRLLLAREMKQAGLDVDLNRAM